MKILILGGTQFLGRHVVDAALAGGHEVTLFHRGRHGADLFPEAERLLGDRDGGLDALRGRRWDVAIDTSGYLPRVVRQSAELLRDAVEHYTFVSTASVYAPTPPPVREDALVWRLPDPESEELSPMTYAGLKVLCERVVREVFPGRSAVVRPGVIVGPHDPMDRFNYWVCRVAEGGEVLVPGRPERTVQFIDARDLARWMLELAGARGEGTYNATGPRHPVSMREWLETCREVSGSDARFTWADDDFIVEAGVEPWRGLPLWFPEESPLAAVVFGISIEKALERGLTFRPLAETVRDTLDWNRANPEVEREDPAISREREREVLEAFHRRAEPVG